ncbi:MAG: gamma-glutamyltransferase [Arenimonas sp.]
MRLPPLAFAALLTCVVAPAHAADRITGRPFATRSEVFAPHVMAATSHPLATQIALETMRAGGSAVDAAIAANAALGLMEPTGSGVGGDLFAIVWDPKTKKLHGYNGSGRSPQALTLQAFRDQGLDKVPSFGPLPVTVPGAVDGWFALHGKFGRRTMAQDLAPAIRYAREGHPVHETIAYYWNVYVSRLGKYPGFLEQFTVDGKRAPRKGELWRNPNLANTLQVIADGGRDAFYKGAIATTIGDYMKAQGGFLSAADLAAHHGEWVEPISTEYRGVTLWELPPNGQGIAALQMLGLLEGFDFSKIAFGSAEHVHLFTEAKKLAFADRAALIADPEFSRSPVERLLAPEYAAQRRKLIDPDKAAKSVDAGAVFNEGDTIYLTVADQDGMMVSLIQSNYRGMGSGMAPPGLGFILQDRGEQFVLKEGHANSYQPGKRPFHTIIPAFLTKDGQPWVSFGVMGGAMQPQGHVQMVVNQVDYGMNPQASLDAPRWQWTKDLEVLVENLAAPSIVSGLAERGHAVSTRPADVAFGRGQIVRRRANGSYVAGSDFRADGCAVGH